MIPCSIIFVRPDQKIKQKYEDRDRTLQIIIKSRSSKEPAADLEAWKRLLEMLELLGTDGMSSEEECEIFQNSRASVAYKVKVCIWRAADVNEYLWMVDAAKKTIKNKKRGPEPRKRIRDGTPSESEAPKGLPLCLYDPEWIKKESDASPVFYENLAVSKKAFCLLAKAADMVA